ncbi:MAG: hypothetical protein CIT03_01935 [Methanobacterium sp.]|nr:MAG: hypothetical protein CIT03_01935 [Methanobacterium sp.]
MNKIKFTFDISQVFISQTIFLLTLFFINLLLGRFLGPSDLGIYTMTYTIFTIASLIGGIGIPVAIVKYVAECKEKKEFKSLIYCSIINSVFFGVFVGIALFFLSSHLSNLFNMPELDYLIKIVSFLIPIYVLNTTFSGILNGLQKIKHYSIVIILRSVTLVFFTLIFVILGWGITGAVISILLSEIGAFIFLIVYLYNKKLFFMSKSYLLSEEYYKTTKMLIIFGFQLFITGAIYYLNTYTDILLVGYFLTDNDLGIYGIALTLSKSFIVISGPLSTISYPLISEYKAKGLYISIEHLITKLIRYSLIILSVLGVLLVLFSNYFIISLLDPDFLDAIIPIAILTIGMISFGTVSSVGMSFSSIGRPDIALKMNFICAILNFCLNLILIPYFGIVGAAIGTSTSFTVLTVLCFYSLNRILNVKIDWFWYVKILGINITTILIFLFFQDKMNIFYILIILILYLIIINKFLLINHDRIEIKHIIKNIKNMVF